MARTSDRPLVTGTISVKNAYIYSILLALIGFIILYTQTTPLAAYIALMAKFLLFYIYIDFKTQNKSKYCYWGCSWSCPVLIGWAATGTELDTGSWLLFLLVFLWTPAHFWALSIENVEDYRGRNFQCCQPKNQKKNINFYWCLFMCHCNNISFNSTGITAWFDLFIFGINFWNLFND